MLFLENNPLWDVIVTLLGRINFYSDLFLTSYFLYSFLLICGYTSLFASNKLNKFLTSVHL